MIEPKMAMSSSTKGKSAVQDTITYGMIRSLAHRKDYKDNIGTISNALYLGNKKFDTDVVWIVLMSLHCARSFTYIDSRKLLRSIHGFPKSFKYFIRKMHLR